MGFGELKMIKVYMESELLSGAKTFSVSDSYNDELSIYEKYAELIKDQIVDFQIGLIKGFAKRINNYLSDSEIESIKDKLLSMIIMEIKIIEGRWSIWNKIHLDNRNRYKLSFICFRIFNDRYFTDYPKLNTSTEISFNNDYSISEIRCISADRTSSLSKDFFAVHTFFDNAYKMTLISYMSDFNSYKSTGNDLSYEDEGLKFSLRKFKNPEIIKEILPEYLNIGVYDFKSEDFEKRFQYCNLIEY